MYLPQGLNAYGTFFKNDTLNVRAGDDVIKEYKGKIFLNEDYVGEASQADTLIFQKGKLLKKAYITIIPWNGKPTFIGKGIVYITPYPLKTTQTTGEGEVYLTGPHKIREYKNQLFLDGLYEGEAYENDTVILRNKSLTIKKAANKRQ